MRASGGVSFVGGLLVLTGNTNKDSRDSRRSKGRNMKRIFSIVAVAILAFSAAVLAGAPVVGIEIVGLGLAPESAVYVAPTIGASFSIKTQAFNSLVSFTLSKENFWETALQLDGVYFVETQLIFPVYGGGKRHDWGNVCLCCHNRSGPRGEYCAIWGSGHCSGFDHFPRKLLLDRSF